MSDQRAPLEVAMRRITKVFPDVIADENVDFEVEAGEIHALMGENGAGKSVLMSILAGLYHPDSGEILLRGEKVSFKSPLDAIEAGIGMVFQEFKLFPSLTIAENVIFRAEPTKRGLVNESEAVMLVREISDRYGLAVDPTMKVSDAPVGVLQRVEIIKALYRDASVLILDEPTAVLTPQETERLFEVLRALKADGRTIILITHKMKEVMAVSDRVTVLRDGHSVAQLVTADTNPQEITRCMVGRDVNLTQRKPSMPPGDVVLDVRDLVVGVTGEKPVVNGLSLQVRRGEILGVAGVAGNGQVELARAIMGLTPALSGAVEINGVDVSNGSTRARRNAGIAYIPEDRRGVGSALEADAVANLAMGHHRSSQLSKRGILYPRKMVQFASELIRRFGVKISSPKTLVSTLSGGNLQKIVVARELDYDAPVLIAEQPTRGVDIGAIEAIHREITDYRDRGRGVLLISAELSEILSLSSRIVVMYEGEIVSEVTLEEATEERLGLLMAGAQEGEVAA